MHTPLVDALRTARAALASVQPRGPAEAAAARKHARELDETLANLEGKPASVDLVSVVCHDLNDPLASITMGAALLQKTMNPADGSTRRVVGAIARSAARLSKVISDFHDLAKLEAGRLTVDVRAYDVATMLPPAVKGFVAQAESAGVQLTFEAPDAPAIARCDAQRLLQAVSNLIANALRFTEQGGRVVVAIEADERSIRVVVSDTGQGIAADRLSGIFDRAVNAARISRDGPGLGLAIVRGLVELQGGDIVVESTVGEGSRFTIRLPKAVESARETR